MSDRDMIFSSDEASVDLFVNKNTGKQAIRVLANRNETGVPREQYVSIELEATNFSFDIISGTRPGFIRRNKIDPFDASNDIEDEDDRALAEEFYQYLSDTPARELSGHALVTLVKAAGWTPPEALGGAQARIEDLERELREADQHIQEMIQAQIDLEIDPEPSEDPFNMSIMPKGSPSDVVGSYSRGGVEYIQHRDGTIEEVVSNKAKVTREDILKRVNEVKKTMPPVSAEERMQRILQEADSIAKSQRGRMREDAATQVKPDVSGTATARREDARKRAREMLDNTRKPQSIRKRFNDFFENLG